MGGGTYLGWVEAVPTLNRVRYLPWMGDGVLAFDEGKGYLPLMGGGGLPTLGYHPARLDGGTPLPPRDRKSRASTCYAAGGMPLAFR